MDATPPLGINSAQTSAYAQFSEHKVYRILLPLFNPEDGEFLRWSEILNAPTESISAATDLGSEMLDAGIANKFLHPRALTNAKTNEQLLAATSDFISPEEQVFVARWRGYSDTEPSGTTASLTDRKIGPWDASEFSIQTETWGSLIASSEVHYPTYLWTADYRFILTCPFYSDSLFASIPPSAAISFESSEIECSEVPEDGPLMVTGD